MAEHQRDEDQSQGDEEDKQGSATDVPWRQERCRKQHGNRRHQKHHLVIDEMEGRQAKTLGDGRTAGHGQNQAEDDQGGERHKLPSIDRPPPIGQR